MFEHPEMPLTGRRKRPSPGATWLGSYRARIYTIFMLCRSAMVYTRVAQPKWDQARADVSTWALADACSPGGTHRPLAEDKCSTRTKKKRRRTLKNIEKEGKKKKEREQKEKGGKREIDEKGKRGKSAA